MDPDKTSAIRKLAEQGDGEITAEVISKSARDGDALAEEIIKEAVDALTAGCISLVNAFGPQRIIMGGGVIEGYRSLIERIAQGVQKRALPAALSDFDIVPAQLGAHAGVIGAAAAARDIKTRKENTQ